MELFEGDWFTDEHIDLSVWTRRVTEREHLCSLLFSPESSFFWIGEFHCRNWQARAITKPRHQLDEPKHVFDLERDDDVDVRGEAPKTL